MLRRKIAITSDRPQTTRHAIRGILTTGQAQIVFVDTPGLHKPRGALSKRLNQVVRDVLSDVDLVCFVVDPSDGVGTGDSYIAAELAESKQDVIVVLNKVDATPIHKMAAAVEALAGPGPAAVWPTCVTSARTGEGIDELIAMITAALPEGPVMYPPEEVTDQSRQQVAAELIREKVLERTRQEVPHAVAVAIEEMKPSEDGRRTEIYATIFVERDSQKGIVIGRGGKMLKEISTSARADIAKVFGEKIFLDVRVKVAKDWQNSDASVQRFGYGSQD